MAFFATFLSNNYTQIVTRFSHGNCDRKLQVKVGKITDKSILQKIQGDDPSAFSELLNFAKTDSGLYDQIHNITSPTYAINLENDTYGSPIIDIGALLNYGDYYYLYVRTDDEDGKYISAEAVTLGLGKSWETGKWTISFIRR